MRPHRGLEVALLTKRRPPEEPVQVFGCDPDPGDPWPLQLHYNGPWLYDSLTPPDADHYRSEWQVHTGQVPYPVYPYHESLSAYDGDPRVLVPRGVGTCKTYSLVGVAMEYTHGRLYFKSRMLSGASSMGAWDLSWTTTVTAETHSNDLLLHIYAEEKFGTAIRVLSGVLHRLDLATGWVPLAPWPAIPGDTHTLRTEFRCLIAGSWCRLHVNGQTHTIDYHKGFTMNDLTTVELVHTQGPGGTPINGVQHGRVIQVSDIAVVSAPANKNIPYPWD